MQQLIEWQEPTVLPNSKLSSSKIKNLQVISIFLERQDAERALNERRKANFPIEKVSVIAKDPALSQELGRLSTHKQVSDQAGQSTRAVIPASYCNRCRFYHGDHRVVCALHPYGPDSKSCSDYAPKASFLNSTDRDGWNIYHFRNWKRWQMLLILGFLGFGFVLAWLDTLPTEPTTNRLDKSGWVR